MRSLALACLLFTALNLGGCVVLKEQNLDRRMDEIAETIQPLGGQPKEVVFERIAPLELGEPVRVEQVSDTMEKYEYHRRYLGGVGGYDQIFLFFENGVLVDFTARGRR